MRRRDPRRQFNSVLFWGNGQSSAAQAYQLVDRFHQALSIQSGIQQPPMATDPAGTHERHMREMAEAEEEIEIFVRDLAMALTGKEIEFVEEEDPVG